MEPSTQTSSPYDDPVVATQAKNLTKAIFQHESGMNYNATGDAGTSKGAGQWQPATWKAQAQDVLGDANAPMTPENQSVVAQGTIRKLIKEGKNAADIAAIWNSGSDKGWQNKVGVATINGQQVKYNVPQYVKAVTDLYQQYKGQPPQGGTSQGGYVTQPSLPPATGTPTLTPNDTLASDISGRIQQGASSLGTVAQGGQEVASGQLGAGAGDIASGLLQTAGAAAGGVGDVIQKGIEQIPGVKSIEGGIADLLGKAAQTPIGQSVVNTVSQLAQDHPEITKDLGAALNIASVLPMFKVVGAIPGIAKDAIGMATQKSLTRAAGDEMVGVASRTIGGREILADTAKRGLDPVQTILDSGALPEVVESADGVPRYSTAAAYEAMNTQPEEDALRYALKSAPAVNGGQVSLEDARKNALKMIAQRFENRTDYTEAISEANKIFDNYISRFGEMTNLDRLNELKRGVRDSVNWNSPKLQTDIHYLIGQSLMDDVESTATKLGVKGVPELNKRMAAKIEARELLKAMDGKQPKVTRIGRVSRTIKKGLAGAAGETFGQMAGIPFAGTLAGMGVEGALIKNLPDSALYKLGLIGTRTNLKSTAKKAVLGAGLLGAARQPQGQQ